MGEVWLAHDQGLNRRVAYKQILPVHADNAAIVARFFEEVQVTAQLDHPNVLPIYNLECTPDGRPAYSMKLVQGRTLNELLAEAATEVADRGGEPDARLGRHLEIFLRICDGMAYAHSKGVLHRDLKPDNIMVGRFNEVYIMDWGICRLMSQPDLETDSDDAQTQMISVNVEDSDRTQTGSIIGTPAYMSPEQALGQNAVLDERSDLYTLGLILQEIVTLRRARPAAQVRVMIRRASRGERDAVPASINGYPVAPELRAIIDKATAANREARYNTVTDLAADIRRHLRGEAVAAKPDNPRQAVLRWAGRHRRGMVISLATTIALGALTIAGLQWRAYEREFELKLERVALDQFLMMGLHQQTQLDNRLTDYKSAIGLFAGRVLQWIIAPPAQALPFHLQQAFDNRAAPGMMLTKRYGMPVSFEVPVVQLAPGLDPVSVQPLLQHVGTLNDAFRNVMIRTAGLAPERMNDTEIRAWLEEAESPVHRASISLNNGVHVDFPGHGGFAADYDARLGRRYQLGANTPGAHLGEPYSEPFTGALLLPVAAGLFDDQHQFRGVVSVDFAFGTLSRELLGARYPPFITDVLLLNDEGRILMQGSPGNPPQPPETEAQRYAHFELFDTDTDRGFGAVDLEDENQYIGYFYMRSSGWYIVVLADRARLIEETDASERG
jgi:serine/threonine-protein kinase